MSQSNIEEFLSSYTDGYVLSHWQIAENGLWERAIPIPADADDEELEKIEQYIDKSDPDIAIEAFFKKSDDLFLFFGIRLESYEPEDQIKIIRKLTQYGHDHDTFSKFIKHLHDMDEFGAVLTTSPDFLEVGAEGFWKSYGSLVVWRDGDQKVLSPQQIHEKAPQLLDKFERSMMLELAYDNPVPHWLGLTLSRKHDDEDEGSSTDSLEEDEDDAFIFDKKRYVGLVKTITGK